MIKIGVIGAGGNTISAHLPKLIDQKNDLSSLNEPFYACVYEKWNSGEMPLTEANTMCSLKFENN